MSLPGFDPRYKLLCVTPELLLTWLFSPKRCGDEIETIEIDGLPEWVRVESVVYDASRGSFVFRLYHDSFEEVLPTHPIPELQVTVKVDRVRVASSSQRGYEFL